VVNFWASHVDMLTGRPVLLPDAFFGEEPVLITPGPAAATTGIRCRSAR
jgi:hypothetical protein